MSEPSLSQELAALKARISELEEALAASLQLNEYYRQQLFGKTRTLQRGRPGGGRRRKTKKNKPENPSP